jgi:hypothetical protein
MNARDIVHSFGLFVKNDPVPTSPNLMQLLALAALFRNSYGQTKIWFTLPALRMPILDTLAPLQIYK